MSNRTKLLIARKWALLIIDWLILLAPVSAYIAYAFVIKGITTPGYIALIGCLAISCIIWMVNILIKAKLHRPIWIILLGLYFALEPVVKSVMPLFIIMAIAAIIDELILTPIIKHTRLQIISNKEIDKRENMA